MTYVALKYVAFCLTLTGINNLGDQYGKIGALYLSAFLICINIEANSNFINESFTFITKNSLKEIAL